MKVTLRNIIKFSSFSPPTPVISVFHLTVLHDDARDMVRLYLPYISVKLLKAYKSYWVTGYKMVTTVLNIKPK